jgi:hypothetical protein
VLADNCFAKNYRKHKFSGLSRDKRPGVFVNVGLFSGKLQLVNRLILKHRQFWRTLSGAVDKYKDG